MCGFLGTFLIKKPINLNVLKHRGPDSNGYYEDENIKLGFCRLKIIDLSDRANQPFIYDNLVMVFNGEIYNFLELKEELKEYEFKTNSDSEVLIYTFHKFGIFGGLKKIVGMFSIAIYDKLKKKVYLIRDRAGIKPMYYSFYKNGLIFSSEIKPILQIIDNKDINQRAIVNHLTFLFNFDEETAFKGIYKLKPAYVLEFSENGYKFYSYWNYEFKNEIENLNVAKEEFEKIFDKVIKSQLISDVEVSLFLSGGIDSSLIGLFASKYKKLKAFSLIYSPLYQKKDIIKDEFFYARHVAEKLNFEIEPIEFNFDEELLNKFVYYIEEPVGDIAGVSTYLMCDYFKSRVVLSGMGGDELFGGYPRYKAYSIYRKFKIFPLHKIPFPHYFKKLSRDIEKFKRVWNKPYYYYLSYYDDQELEKLIKINYNPFEKAKEIYENINGNYYEKMLIFDFKTFLPYHNLLYSDKLSMAKSVELRVPFLDDRILEFSKKLSYALKIDKLLLKSVLRKKFPEIVKRKKMGFGGPVRGWMFENEKFIRSEIEYIKKLDFLNFEEIKKILDLQFQNKKFLDLNVFELLIISRWLKIFGF
jgi:asparagine synthase (glutamine-hydrolysing)